MTLQSEYVDLPLERLHSEASVMKGEGWRFIQTHAVSTDDGIDLYYSFMKDGLVRNYRVKGVQKGVLVPSITDLFLAAFVFENEARELFGVNMRDIAIDFDGGLYAPAVQEPMTIITPEQKAARDKARKAAALKAAKAQVSGGGKPAASPGRFVMTEEKRQKLEAKLATMAAEKVAKVREALAARMAEANAAPAPAEDSKAPFEKEQSTSDKGEGTAAPIAPKDDVLEAKLASMDPGKAAKVRHALGMDVEGEGSEQALPQAGSQDAELAEKLASMDPDKAAKVRAALSARLASEGGE